MKPTRRGLDRSLGVVDGWAVNRRRGIGGLGLGAVLSLGLVHTLHLAAVAAPAAVTTAVTFLCRIH
jgi:hypothetical protein